GASDAWYAADRTGAGVQAEAGWQAAGCDAVAVGCGAARGAEAAVVGNTDGAVAQGAGAQGDARGTDRQAVRLAAGGTVPVLHADADVLGATGGGGAADHAAADVQAQAGRQAAGCDAVAVGDGARGGGQGLAVGRALS